MLPPKRPAVNMEVLVAGPGLLPQPVGLRFADQSKPLSP